MANRVVPSWVLGFWLCVALLPAELRGQPPDDDASCPTSFYEGRIVTPEDVESKTVPSGAKPLWVLGWPCRAIYGGMEKGLIKFEKGKIREKLFDFQQRLAASGYRPLFGGLGEGSGFGFGTIYDYPHRSTRALHLMGRFAPLSGYQDFSAIFDPAPFAGASLNFVANYQWRPNEPYYGFGQNSVDADASSFALRQSSFSLTGISAFSIGFTQVPSTRRRG